MKSRFLTLILATIFSVSCAAVETASHKHESQTNNQVHQQNATNPAEAESKSIEHSPHKADPHMKMTELRKAKLGDSERAAEIAARAEKAIEKYKDYRRALSDDFEILLPNVPQKMYHFNKLAYYTEAESSFNPENPTSLLYEKTADGYRLIGVMYTAPANFTKAELDERVPLSVTQWHQHVNICLPKGANFLNGLIGQGEKFGLEGSITTKEQCDREGGQFLPRLLGWMVHLYPYEQTTEAKWSVERQMNNGSQGHAH
jgi:hypothetical protein